MTSNSMGRFWRWSASRNIFNCWVW